MPTAGLVPHNLRLVDNEEPEPIQAGDFEVQIEEGNPNFETDEKGNILKIEHEDGSVSVSLDGRPIEEVAEAADSSKNWFRNLVDDIDQGELYRIANDLVTGVEDDLQTRREWIEDRAQGLKLLGLKLEVPGLQGTPDGAPVEGMSKVRHPLLLEAVLRFQANARSELLPTDGPVKVRIDSVATNVDQDFLADALEKDLNHYLTSIASEYYPDTDRMLLMLGFGGTAFKKVYYCPLRQRPVSESVDADDLIVNNMATDIRNARRVTHRVFMRPSTIKRLQILGVYRDIDLGTPMPADLDAVQKEKDAQQGITRDAFKAEDRDREVYETYCELNISGFEHKYKGKLTGLEIPYRVTIDVSTKEILSIVRNYDEDSKDLPEARVNFIKYTFVPGLGFYDIGLLHILGNTTNAVTAAWREMLDAGMFANFPGFLMADTGARQNTNIFRVPPGGGALVKTGGLPIDQAIMPLPYKEPGMSLMNLVSNMVETGQRVGGTSELQVGEGRADAAVGTTLAMVEQATKVMNAVHKRLHSAQAEEFQLLVRCFRENPESFWARCKRPSVEWNEQLFLMALDDCQLVPQADPNTASHTQRIMKIMALKQLQSAAPDLYDPVRVDQAALRAMGWSNPEQFMVDQNVPPQPTPEMMEAMAKLDNETNKTKIQDRDSQTRALASQAKIQQDNQRLQMEGIKTQADMVKKQSEVDYTEEELRSKSHDRASKERIQLIDLAQNLAVHPESAPLVAPLIEPALQEIEDQERSDQPSGIMPSMPRPR
jgi:hypothetical protein